MEEIKGRFGTCNWDIDDKGTLTIYPGELGDFMEWDNHWHPYNDKINSVYVKEGVVAHEDSSELFRNLENCKYIDASNLDVSDTVNMKRMFEGCKKANYINLKGWDTSKAINMEKMFNVCFSLNDLKVNHFNTQNLEYANSMFNYCSSLEELKVNKWNTPKLKDMSFMFSNCKNLKEMDISNFNTDNLINLTLSFFKCSSLENVKMCNFEHSNIDKNETYNTFLRCNNLKSISFEYDEKNKEKFLNIPSKAKIKVKYTGKTKDDIQVWKPKEKKENKDKSIELEK